MGEVTVADVDIYLKQYAIHREVLVVKGAVILLPFQQFSAILSSVGVEFRVLDRAWEQMLPCESILCYNSEILLSLVQ